MAVLKMKIGLNIALSLCIQQHPIYLTLISVMLVCIHYIGVNLVKVARQYGMLIEKPLHILTIVLGVDNQCPVIDCQGNIRLQGRGRYQMAIESSSAISHLICRAEGLHIG